MTQKYLVKNNILDEGEILELNFHYNTSNFINTMKEHFNSTNNHIITIIYDVQICKLYFRYIEQNSLLSLDELIKLLNCALFLNDKTVFISIITNISTKISYEVQDIMDRKEYKIFHEYLLEKFEFIEMNDNTKSCVPLILLLNVNLLKEILIHCDQFMAQKLYHKFTVIQDLYTLIYFYSNQCASLNIYKVICDVLAKKSDVSNILIGYAHKFQTNNNFCFCVENVINTIGIFISILGNKIFGLIDINELFEINCLISKIKLQNEQNYMYFLFYSVLLVTNRVTPNTFVKFITHPHVLSLFCKAASVNEVSSVLLLHVYRYDIRNLPNIVEYTSLLFCYIAFQSDTEQKFEKRLKSCVEIYKNLSHKNNDDIYDTINENTTKIITIILNEGKTNLYSIYYRRLCDVIKLRKQVFFL